MGFRAIARRWMRSWPPTLDERIQIESELLFVGQRHELELSLPLTLLDACVLVRFLRTGTKPCGGDLRKAPAFSLGVVLDVQGSQLRVDPLSQPLRVRLLSRLCFDIQAVALGGFVRQHHDEAGCQAELFEYLPDCGEYLRFVKLFASDIGDALAFLHELLQRHARHESR